MKSPLSRVLIVDDHAQNRYYLEALLKGHGYIVQSAAHGAEALVLARQQCPDLVVSDLLMPVMDGYTLLRHWKLDPRLRQSPFVVYTATYTEPEDERLALSLGADAFILKPAEPEAFVAELNRVFLRHTSAPIAPRQPGGDETTLLKTYSETLIRKLEEKSLLLEESNRALQADIAERRRLAETQTAILNALPAQLALIDGQGVILAVNESWREFAAAHGEPTGSVHGVGENYLAVCDRAATDEGRVVAAGIREVLAGRRSHFTHEYLFPALAGDERWFRLMVTPLRPGGATGAVVMHIDVTERTRADQAVRLSEERFRLLSRATHDAIWDWDLATNALWWNEGYEDLFGRPRSSVSPTLASWTDYLHPDDLERVKGSIYAAIASDATSWSTEYRFRRHDGRYAYVLDRGHVIRDRTGRAVRMIGGMMDLTERKRAEEETRRANETLGRIVATLQEIATANLALADLMKVMTQRAQELTGAVGAVIELIEGDRMVYCAGSGLLAGGDGRQLPRLDSFSGRAVESGQTLVCDDSAADERLDRDAWSGVGLCSIVVAPLRDGPKTLGVLKVVAQQPRAFTPRDVANLQILVESLGTVIQRLSAIEQLRASEEQYRLLFTNNPHPMWVWDRETLRFLAVNRAAVRHYGYTEEEFLARTILDIRAPDDATTFATAIAKMPAQGPTFGLRRHRRKDGSIIDVEGSSDSVVLNGRPAWLALAHDITDRLRAERELARTHRALRMLTRCNEALVRAQTEDALLHAICEIAAENGGYRLAWVGYARDDERKSIEVRASAGHVAGFFDGAQLSWDERTAIGHGPAGRAVRSGEITACDDIASDATTALWRDAALQRGYASVICLPLREDSRVFGVLGLYSGDPRRFGADELELLRELADNLAFGLVGLRTRSEQRRLQAAVVKVAAGVSAATGTEFFEKLAASMAEAVGAHAAAVARLLPDSSPTARMLAVVQAGQAAPHFDFPVNGTPCEALLHDETAVVPSRVSELFPHSPSALLGGQAYIGHRLSDSTGRALGVLFVIFREPLHQTEFIRSTLRIFAARAAAEIERQQTDQHVREQAALLDSAQDAILVRDLQHRISYWNKSAERLYGWRTDEVRGRSVRELLYSDPAQFDGALQQLLTRGEWVGELAHVRKDGTPLVIEGHWTLVRDETGQPKSVLAINTNITERKKLEQQFFRAQRMESIGTLAGGIAHDLNNLLVPILMGVDLLRQFEPRAESVSLLNNIERSARRGADLVKQVLSFARGIEGARVAVHLGQIVSEVQAIARSTFPKNVIVETDILRLVWGVSGDATQLNQVLLNLCVNARDAMPSGGRLGMSLRNVVIDEHYAAMNPPIVAGRYVLLEVSDTGGGIPPELVDRIFEPFFTTKEVGKGTGLGLSTALGIVRSHGGFINVESAPGKGSVFKVHLPAQTDDDAAGDAFDSAPSLPHGRGEWIMIVDDESSILDVTRHTLEAFGYRVLTAENGAQATALFATHETDIAAVLTDMMMPVMDGPALIAALRRIDPQVRIIAASGLKANDGVARSSHPEVNAFLPKPYSVEVMLRTLREVLGTPESSGPNASPDRLPSKESMPGSTPQTGA